MFIGVQCIEVLLSPVRSEPPPEAQATAGCDRRDLLARHLLGDMSAFAELMREFKAPVYSYILRSGVRGGAEDDIFQEVFIKVHGAASSYQPTRPLEPWLFTIVANTVRSHFRRQRVRELADEQGELTPSAPESISAHDIAEAQETVSWIEQALQSLPLAQREAIILCGMRQLSQQDVSLILGIPVNTVKTHLKRGRDALAQALAKRNKALKREVQR